MYVMGDFLYLSVLAFWTLYFSVFLVIIWWDLTFSGNQSFVFGFFKHFWANFKQIFSLLSCNIFCTFWCFFENFIQDFPFFRLTLFIKYSFSPSVQLFKLKSDPRLVITSNFSYSYWKYMYSFWNPYIYLSNGR